MRAWDLDDDENSIRSKWWENNIYMKISWGLDK